MSSKIFREKSLERIKSPESLSDYIRVVNPGTWMVLAAVLLFLTGVLIWGLFGTVKTKLPAQAKAENGVLVCTVDPGKTDAVETGMKIVIGNSEGTVTDVDSSRGEITAEADIPDGMYTAYIITEKIRPLSFVIN